MATNLYQYIFETSHNLIAVSTMTRFLFYTIPFSSYDITEIFKFHFAFPVIPVDKIMPLCYTNIRPDIKKAGYVGIIGSKVHAE